MLINYHKEIDMKIKRETKRINIQNRYAIGNWVEYGTFIYLTFLGIKIKTLHSYFISYRGMICDLSDNWRYY